jgi:hypothetical protein
MSQPGQHYVPIAGSAGQEGRTPPPPPPQQQQQQQQQSPAPGTSWPRTWQDAAGWQARDPVVSGSLTGG